MPGARLGKRRGGILERYGDRQFLSHAVIKNRLKERHDTPKAAVDHCPFGIQAKDGTPIGVFIVG